MKIQAYAKDMKILFNTTTGKFEVLLWVVVDGEQKIIVMEETARD